MRTVFGHTHRFFRIASVVGGASAPLCVRWPRVGFRGQLPVQRCRVFRMQLSVIVSRGRVASHVGTVPYGIWRRHTHTFFGRAV